MLTLKRSNLSAFITRERTLLTTLWDTLYLSPTQRLATFPPFSINVDPILVYNSVTGVEEEVVNENVSEELLVAHERERERVEEEVEEMRPVLERLGRYFGVVEEMRELEVGVLFSLSLSLSGAVACTCLGSRRWIADVSLTSFRASPLLLLSSLAIPHSHTHTGLLPFIRATRPH